MFDISAPELLTILIIALIVFGPRRLPELAKRVGRWTSELRKVAREIRSGLEDEVESLKEPIDEIRSDIETPLRETAAELKDLDKDLKSDITWSGPEPESGPTSQDAQDDLAEIERTERPLRDPDQPEGDSES